MKTLIRHARVISPDLDADGASLLFENGRILAVIHPGESMPDAELTVDADGRIAMPGFFDIHSHGADGKDVCDGSPDSIRHIARRKLDEGVTTWLPTTLT
ncbi:MAG: N-acetylglucosamine-6-phosphate deacetylase, partial [Luteolibacter sp.]